jgi:hypothetical protein
MLAGSAILGSSASPASAAAAAARSSADDPAILARECATFTTHVLGTRPEPAILEAYVRAHAVSRRFAAETAFDDRLVAFARRHPAATRLADQYARLAAPTGLLRRKLVLLLAILETTPPHYRAIDAPLAGSPIATVVALAGRGAAATLAALAAIVVLGPLHLVSRGLGRS